MRLNLKIFAQDHRSVRKPKYTRRQLTDFYWKAVKKLGHEPSFDEFRSLEGYPSNTVILAAFKTWNKYKKAAGGTVLRVQKKYTNEQLLEMFFKDSKRKTKKLTHAQLETIARRFGGRNEARKKAGLEPKNERLSDQELLQRLRKAKIKKGHVPTAAEIDEMPGIPSANTYRNRLGGLNKSYMKIKIKPIHKRYSHEELINFLILGEKILGDLPNAPELKMLRKRYDFPSPATFIEHFGSLEESHKAVILKTN